MHSTIYLIFLLYCCLGSRVGRGKDEFLKVDYQYPVDFANLAKQLDAKVYFLVSSSGSKANSCNLYLKTKGKVEMDIKQLELKHLVIMKPGLLLDRDNDYRLGEKIASWVPFIPKVTWKEVACSMIEKTVELINKEESIDALSLDNSTILKSAKLANL